MSNPFRGRAWQGKLRRRAYDPVLCEVPRDLWALPAHVAQMGPFTIAEVRSFPGAPSFKLYLDIVLTVNAERYTLILPSSDATWMEIDRWLSYPCPPWRYTIVRRVGDFLTWHLDRVPDPNSTP